MASKVSENARAVAYKVVDKVRKGEVVSVGKIMREQGYSEYISQQPNRVTSQQVYKDIVNPVVEQMNRIRSKALDALEKKDMRKEKMPVLLAGVEVMTKNSQLLGGKATENVGVIVDVSERIHNKYKQVSSETVKDITKP